MAITASGLYVKTWLDILDTTQLAINVDTGSFFKLALVNNSTSPDFSNDTTYTASTYSTNEVYGTGWSQGGVVLGTVAVAETSPAGGIKMTAGNVSQTSTTLSNAYAAFVYADGLGGKNSWVLVYFGGSPYSTSNGTFAITWAAGGVFAIDLTP